MESDTNNMFDKIEINMNKYVMKEMMSNTTSGNLYKQQACQEYQYLYGQEPTPPPQQYHHLSHHQINFKSNQYPAVGSDKKLPPPSISTGLPYGTPTLTHSHLDDGKLNAYPNSYYSGSSSSKTNGCGSGLNVENYTTRLEQSACHQQLPSTYPKSSNQFAYTQYNYPSITNIAACPTATTTTVAETTPSYYSPSYYEQHKTTNVNGNIQTELATNYGYSCRTNSASVVGSYHNNHQNYPPNQQQQQQQQQQQPNASNYIHLEKSSPSVAGYTKSAPYMSQYSAAAYYGGSSNYTDVTTRSGSSSFSESPTTQYHSYQAGKNISASSSYSDLGGDTNSMWNECQSNQASYPSPGDYVALQATKDFDRIYSQDKYGAYYPHHHQKTGRHMWQPYNQYKSTSSSTNQQTYSTPAGSSMGYSTAQFNNNCCSQQAVMPQQQQQQLQQQPQQQQQQLEQMLPSNGYYKMINHQTAPSLPQSSVRSSYHHMPQYPPPAMPPHVPYHHHTYSVEKNRPINLNNNKLPNSDLYQHRYRSPYAYYSHSNSNSNSINSSRTTPTHSVPYNYPHIYPSRPPPPPPLPTHQALSNSTGACCNNDLNYQTTNKLRSSLPPEHHYLMPTSSYHASFSSSSPQQQQRLIDKNTFAPEFYVQSQHDYSSSQIQDLSLSPSNCQSETNSFTNLNGELFVTTNSNDSKDSLPSLTKTQSLRDFLTSWNEDEDDCTEKNLNSPTNLTFIDEQSHQQTYHPSGGIEIAVAAAAAVAAEATRPETISDDIMSSTNSPNSNHQIYENHLQLKSSFSTRPKIHVGITVDSSEINSYMNLPDIVIDIEKANKDMTTAMTALSTAASVNINTNSTTPPPPPPLPLPLSSPMALITTTESVKEFDSILETDVDKLFFSKIPPDIDSKNEENDYFKLKHYEPVAAAIATAAVESSSIIVDRKQSKEIDKLTENTDVECEIPFTKVILPPKTDNDNSNQRRSNSLTPSKLRKGNVVIGCRKHLSTLRRFRFNKTNPRSRNIIKPYRYRRYQLAQRRFAKKVNETCVDPIIAAAAATATARAVIVFNPKSLKCLSISVINSDNFRKMFESIINKNEEEIKPLNLTMIQNIETTTTTIIIPKSPIRNNQQIEILSTTLLNNNEYREKQLQQQQQIIPKLSDLCKNALNSSFDCENKKKHKNNDDIKKIAKVSKYINTKINNNNSNNNNDVDHHDEIIDNDGKILETTTADVDVDVDVEREEETQEVLVINLDEILDSDNLFVVQCDINENILENLEQNDNIAAVSNTNELNEINDGTSYEQQQQQHQQQQQQHEFHPVHLVKILNDDEIDCDDDDNDDDDDDDFDDDNSKVDSLMSATPNYLPSSMTHSNPTSPHSIVDSQNNDHNHITNENDNSNNYYISHFDNNHSMTNDNNSSSAITGELQHQQKQQHEQQQQGEQHNNIMMITTNIPSPISLSSSSSTASFSALSVHHEEIVPDNYKKFENEKFLKYMHTKYVQRNISQFYHANKIIKKYKKHLLKKVLKYCFATKS